MSAGLNTRRNFVIPRSVLLRRALAEARKEWREFKRDRLSLALAFALPLLSLFLFGYGIRLESKNIHVRIQDSDMSRASRELIDCLYATNVLIPVSVTKFSTLEHLIHKDEATVVAIIPNGMERNLALHRNTKVQFILDGDALNQAYVARTVIEGALANFARMHSTPDRNWHYAMPKVTIWFNPDREQSLFIVPGVFGVVLWMYPSLLAAVAIARERDQGTIVQIYASRLNACEFILGKAIFYLAIGLAEALVIIPAGCAVFQFMPVGDPLFFAFSTVAFIASAVLFGLTMGTFTNSQTAAVQATSTGGFFPSLLLSGFVYPISNIPFPLTLFSLAVPARYYIEISRDVFVRGSGWSSTWQDAAALVAFVFVFFLLTWLGLRKMQLKE